MKLRYKLPGGRKRLLRDWIAALRSGKYEQCRLSYSKNDRTFCAAGLLGHIACEGHVAASKFLKVERGAVIRWNDVYSYGFSEIADNLEILYG